MHYTVTVKANGLCTGLSVWNLNGQYIVLHTNDTTLLFYDMADKEPFSFTWLLHTYFKLPDVSKTTISGLKGLTYIDKVIHIVDFT